MSELHLQKVLSVDPKTNVEETWKQQEIIHKGGIQKTRYKIAADSASSNNFQWNSVSPSSLKTVIERSLRVLYTLRITVVTQSANIANRPIFPAVGGFAAVSANGTLFSAIGVPIAGPYSGCLRNFPLQSCSVSTELKINGNSTSVNSSEFINNYSLMMTDKEINRYVEFPAQPDNSALYIDNGIRSPFTAHNDNPALNTRASFMATLLSSVYTAAVIGPPVVAAFVTDVYQFNVVEQLIVSPFTFGDAIDTSAGLSNIDNISLNINLDNVNRCISVMPANCIPAQVSITTSFVGGGDDKPFLLMEYITPDPVLAERMPQQIIYTYENVKVENCAVAITNINTLNVTSGAQVSATLRAASIPDKLFIFAKPSKSSLSGNAYNSFAVTNSYLNITNLILQWGNSDAKFTSYTEYDLYKMSVANGLKSSWYDWKYGGQCLVIIDVTKDVCLQPDETVGQANTYMTYQFTVTVNNAPLVAAAANPLPLFNLSVMNITNGKCVISHQNCQFLLTAPNGQEVLATTSDPKEKVDANSLPVDKAHSASLFGASTKLISRGLNLASKIKPEHLDMAKAALDQLNGGSVVAAGLHKKGHRRVY